MNKTVLITGATGGIGKALATTFAQAGYQLALNCHTSVDALKQLCKDLSNTYGVSCLPVPADVGCSRDVSQMFHNIKEVFSHVDVLINNSGITHFGLLSHMSDDQWRRLMATNLDGMFYCCREAIPAMVQKKQGRILNICSVWGERGASYEVAYSASKGAMISFTKALAKELAPSNIPVNAIAPGVVDTAMNDELTSDDLTALKDEIPSGRFAQPEEISKTALFLASAPSYLTGQILGVNGGWF